MKLRVDIKRQAKIGFTAQYGVSIGAYILTSIISGVFTLLLYPPMAVGYAHFCLSIYKGEMGDIGELFSAGFNDYGRNLGGILWMYLFVWLWSLLFIIPGIIKSFAYFATPYILADSKNVAPMDALKISMRMTYGHKGDIFVMYLSFIGWLLLNLVTFGLLQLLFTGPYMATSLGGMYVEIKEDAIARGVVTAEELA